MAADKEGKVQKQVLDWLKDHGFWAFKTIVCNKSGIMDIIGCTPKGRFFGIEMKYGAGKASAIQKYHIEEVKKRNGIAFVSWDLETVIHTLQSEIQDVKRAQTKTKHLL